MNIENIGAVQFPIFSKQMVNMMPVVAGDPSTVPEALRGYLPMLQMCRFDPEAVVFMTVNEVWVDAGRTQRREGIHTDGTSRVSWGGGGWGASALSMSDHGGSPSHGGKPTPAPSHGGVRSYGGGIYMASTDGACRAWDSETYDVDHHGQLLGAPEGACMNMEASQMYCMSDRVPHESLAKTTGHHRQFFRAVGPEVTTWWAQHNTANPLCPVPSHITVDTSSKFAE